MYNNIYVTTYDEKLFQSLVYLAKIHAKIPVIDLFHEERLEKFIIDNGGIVSDSLTKNTTFLVVPSLDTESSKVSKAKKYGIQIVHIDDLESTLLKYLNK